MRTAKLIITGFGTIGRGTAEVLQMKRAEVKRRFGLDLRVVAICEASGCLVNDDGIDLSSALKYAEAKNLAKHPDWKNKKGLDVIEKTDADMVVDLTPGNIKTGEPGLSNINAALDSGKHVVTSNKSPIALKFYELAAKAEKKGLGLGYEATVAGAIPIINLYRNNLQINKVTSIYGILNGTSNFVLTKMQDEDVPLETALKEAQERGIAETDPSYDIKGVDSAVKLVILANAIMDKKIKYSDVRVCGIEDVTPEALSLAKKHGYTVKLIADVNDKAVSPRLVPLNHPLNVSGSLNAVMLETDVAGTLTLVGNGAGRIETTSSVYADVIDILTRYPA